MKNWDFEGPVITDTSILCIISESDTGNVELERHEKLSTVVLFNHDDAKMSLFTALLFALTIVCLSLELIEHPSFGIRLSSINKNRRCRYFP